MDNSAWAEHERAQETYWWHRHKRDLLLDLAEQDPYSKVLEIGSGGGSLILRLTKPSQRVTCDLEARHVKPGGVAARLPNLCFKDETFDLVFLSDVLEHLDQPVESLQTIRRIMKPGGRCLITVPAWPALWSDHDLFYGHKKRYTPTQFQMELTEAGFILRRRGWFFLMPLGAAWIRQGLHVLKTAIGRTVNPGRPQSGLVALPEAINRACYTYLNLVERPLAVRFLLPIGLTYAAIAVKSDGRMV